MFLLWNIHLTISTKVWLKLFIAPLDFRLYGAMYYYWMSFTLQWSLKTLKMNSPLLWLLMALIFFFELISIMAWNFLKTTKAFNFFLENKSTTLWCCLWKSWSTWPLLLRWFSSSHTNLCVLTQKEIGDSFGGFPFGMDSYIACQQHNLCKNQVGG